MQVGASAAYTALVPAGAAPLPLANFYLKSLLKGILEMEFPEILKQLYHKSNQFNSVYIYQGFQRALTNFVLPASQEGS